MIKASDVSIVIITRNRVYELGRLVQSLSLLTDLPKEVVIITRSQEIQPEQTIIAAYPQLNMELIYQEQATGYAGARNLGVKNSIGKIIAFVDDDCVVPTNWISEVVAAHNQWGSEAVVMGRALSRPKNNFYAATAELHYQNWVKSNCVGNRCYTLDAKITSFNRQIFFKHNAWFDEVFKDGWEDVELGYRLNSKDIQIVYEPKIFILHYERSQLFPLLKQRWRNAKGEVLISRALKNQRVGIFPVKRSSKFYLTVKRQFSKWIREGKFDWCIEYILILPIFIMIRTVGYSWGMVNSHVYKN